MTPEQRKKDLENMLEKNDRLQKVDERVLKDKSI